MIPKINPRGHSFQGIMSYLMHDKNASSAERVDWFETGNLYTNDPEKAANAMAWTDKHSGFLKEQAGVSAAGAKQSKGNVYHYSLGLEPGNEKEAAHLRKEALESLQRLGLQEHEFVLVGHNDTHHKHVHVVVNLVNPENGKVADIQLDRKTLRDYAQDYEMAHGIQCKTRDTKHQARQRERDLDTEAAKRKTHESLAEKVNAAYHNSDSSKAFIDALKENDYTLARGNKRGFVLVDDQGKIRALARLIQEVKTRDISARLKDVERSALPDAEAFAAEHQAKAKQLKTRQETTPRQADEPQQEKSLFEEQQTAKRAQAKADFTAQNAQHFKDAQREIDDKTEASRRQWDIDQTIEAKAAAEAAYERKNGFWYRLFNHRSFAEAYTEREAQQQKLAENMAKHKADIEVINEHRPEYVRKREKERAEALHAEQVKAKNRKKEEQAKDNLHADIAGSGVQSDLSPKEASGQAFIDRGEKKQAPSSPSENRVRTEPDQAAQPAKEMDAAAKHQHDKEQFLRQRESALERPEPSQGRDLER